MSPKQVKKSADVFSRAINQKHWWSIYLANPYFIEYSLHTSIVRTLILQQFLWIAHLI